MLEVWSPPCPYDVARLVRMSKTWDFEDLLWQLDEADGVAGT